MLILSLIGLTWIIIVLIVLSIAVTGSEVFLRFGILSKIPKTAVAYGGAMSHVAMSML